MLRRKRGADYDLSDSDDGGEARRRMKRRQFAKMQKALFADERISKVAENPRNQAFMRTIEDVGSDDDMEFLFEPPPAPQSEGSQSQEQTVPDSQPAATAAALARQPLAPAQVSNRPPTTNRRTKNGKKPSNIGEIRESLSNLLEEPSLNTVISSTDLGSDSDDADDEQQAPRSSNKENDAPQHGRRTNKTIVDRISLKRQGSSSASSVSSGGRMAFAAPSASAGGSFKVPALLRRATTNSLMSTSSGSSGGSTHGAGAGGFGEEAKIKKSAGKRSGINSFARENERRAALEESSKRREAKKWKGAEGRVKVVGGLFGAGKFE